MTSRFPWIHRLGTIVLTIMLVPVIPAAQEARLQLPDFEQLAGKASEVVDITVDETMLGLAGQFMADEDEGDVKALLKSLRGVYVRSYEFSEAGMYSADDVEAIRRQLGQPGWKRLVNVREQQEQTDIYVWMKNGKPDGLAILAAEPTRLTVVNIVGAVDLEKLRDLGGSFGIPDIDLDPGPKEQD